MLDKVKQVPEVCGIYAATANPLEVLIAETETGRGIIGVVDGCKSKGIEGEKDDSGTQSVSAKDRLQVRLSFFLLTYYGF